VVNTTVENLSVREKRRQRFLVQVTYDTSRHQLEELVMAIRQLLADNALVDPGTSHVRFNNFAESSLDILLIFNLLVEDYASELMAREAILLQVMDLVKEAGVEFAFPTRTLYLDSIPSQSSPRADQNLLGVAGRI
jgi:MscS family membrane protein